MSRSPQNPRAWLKICRTCDRQARPQGALGAALAAATYTATASLRESGRLTFLRVPCLSGCQNPGNVAIGATGKAKLRLHRLGTCDAANVAELIEAYLRSPTGEIPMTDWPERLRPRLATAVVPYR